MAMLPRGAGGRSFDLQGLDKVQAELKRLKTAAPKAAGTALYQEAEAIMTDSKDNYVPVLHGGLKSSGHVKKPTIEPGRVTVEMGYGGPAAPYALFVHEIPPPEEGAPHPDQWEPGTRTARHTNGSWKYLERPVKAAEAGMNARLAAKLAKAIIK